MKLSIITVNLNNRDGLRKTIDSVVGQSFKDFEWIVIDGGSTDGSRELIEENAGHFAYWCSEPDNGIYNAMNKGVGHAGGEYCQFLNSGDLLAGDDVLEVAAEYMGDGDVLYGGIHYTDDGRIAGSRIPPHPLHFEDLYYGTLGHNASFIRTELLLANPYDEKMEIASDWKFFFQMFLQGRSFYYIDKYISCFDLGGISQTCPELLRQERDRTMCELASLILPHLRKEVDRAESHLAHTRLDEFSALCERHRLTAKLITALVLIFKRHRSYRFHI